MTKQGATSLGEGFERALRLALRWHEGTTVKGRPDVPYVSHLLGVASLVLADGGSEDEAMAALLHDVLEDTEVTRAELAAAIGGERGDRIATVVWQCSDGVDKKGIRIKGKRGHENWKSRKDEYIAHLRDAEPGALRVSNADKLHNARTLAHDVRTAADPASAWMKFNAPPSEQLWFYRSVVDIFSERRGRESMLVTELETVVEELERLPDPDAADAAWSRAHPEAKGSNAAP